MTTNAGNQPRPQTTRCPECDSRIYFARTPDLGQLVVCPECGTSLEVISTKPIRLDWADDERERYFGVEAPATEEDDEYFSTNQYDYDDEDANDDWR